MNTALKALKAPPPQKLLKKTLKDKAREKHGRKKKRRKQRNAEIANQKNEASRESPFQLVDKTKCGYLRAHVISVKRYNDPVKMFQDKKFTIKTKITAELQELTGLKWSFGREQDNSLTRQRIYMVFGDNSSTQLKTTHRHFLKTIY